MGRTAAAREQWVHAVALGATGRVARGRTILNDAERTVGAARSGDGLAILSLITSTRASWVRQSGRHDQALGLDGKAALLLAPLLGGGRVLDGWSRAAFGDALIGMAADNLGVGRFDVSSRLLERARTAGVSSTTDNGEWLLGDRVALRWRWVCAETALYRGDAATGRRWAEEAVELAAVAPSAHHRIKTALIAAAAMAATGATAEAIEQARGVIDDAAQAGLRPLEWAGWQLLAGLDPGPDALAGIDATTAALRVSGFFPTRVDA